MLAVPDWKRIPLISTLAAGSSKTSTMARFQSFAALLMIVVQAGKARTQAPCLPLPPVAVTSAPGSFPVGGHRALHEPSAIGDVDGPHPLPGRQVQAGRRDEGLVPVPMACAVRLCPMKPPPPCP